MARKRKRIEEAPVTLEELPRDTEALTSEEAEAAKGGFLSIGWAMYAMRLKQDEQEADALINPFDDDPDT